MLIFSTLRVFLELIIFRSDWRNDGDDHRSSINFINFRMKRNIMLFLNATLKAATASITAVDCLRVVYSLHQALFPQAFFEFFFLVLFFLTKINYLTKMSNPKYPSNYAWILYCGKKKNSQELRSDTPSLKRLEEICMFSFSPSIGKKVSFHDPININNVQI